MTGKEADAIAREIIGRGQGRHGLVPLASVVQDQAPIEVRLGQAVVQAQRVLRGSEAGLHVRQLVAGHRIAAPGRGQVVLHVQHLPEGGPRHRGVAELERRVRDEQQRVQVVRLLVEQLLRLDHGRARVARLPGTPSLLESQRPDVREVELPVPVEGQWA